MTKNEQDVVKSSKKTPRIGIIGSGVVGQTTGKGFVEVENNVTFYDIDENKIETLKKEGFQATTNLEIIVKNSDVIFLCVPTPTKNGKIDLSYVKSVIRDIAKISQTKRNYFLIVIKSTVVPTTTEKMITLFEKQSGKKVGIDFGMCFNPEFLRENNAFEDFMNPDRIVIGEYDKKSGDILEDIYRKFNCPILRTSLRTAEMVKYANNCFYATKISFFNEIHMMCQKLGIDSNFVRKLFS
jgi:UDPglucose 6-dehydrogenase